MMKDSGNNGAPEVLDDDAFQIHAGFRYVIRRFLRYSEDQARLAGITPQQHLLLLAVRGHPAFPAVTIKDVAHRLQLRHHSTSLLVDRAVKRGLVARGSDPTDRRRVVVGLTDEGRRILDVVTRANRAELRALDTEFLDVHRSLSRIFEPEAMALAHARGNGAAGAAD
ncbi:MAG TPA: MarR family transcriptional regulator [Chloroflexota bacterium]|nr:MarR family transcriptional regulator [Chloroflexota bacterium]